MGRGKGESALKSVQIVGWFSQNNRNPNPASEPHVIWQRPLFSLSPSHRAPRALFFFLPSLPTSQKGLCRGERPGQGNVATQFLPNELKFNATSTQKRRPVRNARLFIRRFNRFNLW